MKYTRIAMIAVIAAIVFGTTQAHAYCVYNRSYDIIMEVMGETCARCLNTSGLGKGQHACCPGDKEGCRGETWITVRVPTPVYADPRKKHYKHFGKRVPAHGWVNIQGAGEMLSGQVYDKNGKLLWSGALEEGQKW